VLYHSYNYTSKAIMEMHTQVTTNRAIEITLSNAVLKKFSCTPPRITLGITLGVALLIALSAFTNAMASEGVLHTKSHYSVERTVERAKRILEHHGFRVFGVIDHQDNAQQKNLSLPPTQLLVFGQVEAGTALMNQNRLIGIDLPLKLLVWQDDKRIVWISYSEPNFLQKRHAMESQSFIFDKMRGVLQDISSEAAE